jgi:hypothetical protein
MNNRHRGKVNDLVTIALVEGRKSLIPKMNMGIQHPFGGPVLDDLELG